jgi:hypothetical protein
MRASVLAAAAALLLVPAAAPAAEPVVLDDVCGDEVPPLARVGGTSIGAAEAQRRSPRHDLDPIVVRAADGEVSVRFELCGPIGSPEPVGETVWALDAELDGGCTVGLSVQDGRFASRHGSWYSACPQDRTAAIVYEPRWERTLPAGAVTLEDGSVVVRLRAAGLPPAEAAPLAAGTRWTRVAASTSVRPLLSWAVVYGDDRVYAPGPSDAVRAARPLVVE